ncbi:MAG: RodZ domain-containing protein [Sphingomonas sp.]|jgi:cytoskeletal protein RodZ|uniref:helix-turn-helix domain-containing protein n=1 Tax=Sphingomonas sp. TaxID=28214 RepID=UPI0035666BC4
MTDTDPGEEATLFPKTAGERLREAREAQGLSLAEIAARTRIPIRQLEAIETSNFAALPSITYSVGFAKAYARAVGADEVAIARDVRAQNDQGVRRTEYEAYEVTEASKVPTGGIALITAIVAVLLLIGAGLWYGTTLFRTEEVIPAPIENVEEPAPVATPTPAASGQVTLTATDDVWMRVYDATGTTLYENTLKPGDRYDVPANANNPMINIGRPDKLQVMLNGSLVAPLGDGKVAIKDVPIGAAALQARANGIPLPTASATPATATGTPATTTRTPVTRSTPRAQRTPAATAPSPTPTAPPVPPAFAPAPAPTTAP